MKKRFYQTDSFKVGIGILIGIVLYRIIIAAA